jgi:hypothetical protein
LTEKAKPIERWTFGVVIMSTVFSIYIWVDTGKELSETNIQLNNANTILTNAQISLVENEKQLNKANTTLTKAQTSLVENEKNLADVNSRLGEVKIKVEELSAENTSLENTLHKIEIATKPKRDRVALAREVRESVQSLTPKTSIGTVVVSIEANHGSILWEIENIGQSPLEIVLLDLQISEKTPLYFNKLAKHKAALSFNLISGILASSPNVGHKPAPYSATIDRNLIPTVAFSYPSLISPEQTSAFRVRFAVDELKEGVNYYFRAIFGARTEVDYYLKTLDADRDAEAYIISSSRRLIFSSDEFFFSGNQEELITIEDFISENGLGQRPNSVEILFAQWYLKKLGYRKDKEDGKLGPKTEAEIRQFQENKNMPISGELDIRTITSLVNEASKFK